MLVPLADCLNHSPANASITIDILEKNLHKSMNKIYLYKHQFNEVSETDEDVDKIYDKSNSKLKIKCQKLFSEDEIAALPDEVKQAWLFGEERKQQEN